MDKGSFSSRRIFVLLDDSQDVLHVILAAQEDRAPLVKLLWNHVQDINPGDDQSRYEISLGDSLSSRGEPTGLLDDESHGHALVQHTQLAIGVGSWGARSFLLHFN